MTMKLPSWIYSSWWKYTSLLLLLYVLVGGLFVPLGPGLHELSPSAYTLGGKTVFNIKGYNTHFLAAKNNQVFLRKSGTYFCTTDVKVMEDESLRFAILLNGEELKGNYDVIVNNNQDGTIALREGITVLRDTIAGDSIVTASCEPSVASNLHKGFSFPYREILYESIRNTFYHVPMWFGMLFVLILSLVYSIRYLLIGKLTDDWVASEAVKVALLAGVLGLITGMIWANYTWGAPWPNDPKLNGAAVGVLIYVAYIVLRGAIADTVKRARIAAVYNIFAIVIYLLFIFIIPRITDSLHPGNGGNPAFSKYDMDSHMRMFFYPAVIAWSGLFLWIASVRVRILFLEFKKESDEE